MAYAIPLPFSPNACLHPVPVNEGADVGCGCETLQSAFSHLEFPPIFRRWAFIFDVVRGEVDGDVAHLDHSSGQRVPERVATAAARGATVAAAVPSEASLPTVSKAVERSDGHDDLNVMFEEVT